jgi:hypothetical protein
MCYCDHGRWGGLSEFPRTHASRPATDRHRRPKVTMTDEARRRSIELLPQDTTINSHRRVAGLFLLLFAWPLNRVLRMTHLDRPWSEKPRPFAAGHAAVPRHARDQYETGVDQVRDRRMQPQLSTHHLLSDQLQLRWPLHHRSQGQQKVRPTRSAVRASIKSCATYSVIALSCSAPLWPSSTRNWVTVRIQPVSGTPVPRLPSVISTNCASASSSFFLICRAWAACTKAGARSAIPSGCLRGRVPWPGLRATGHLAVRNRRP